MPASVKPGVVTGKALIDLLDHAKKEGFAIPGVNVVGTNSINSCMEAAKKYGGPIMVTFSKGGGQFIAGKAAMSKLNVGSTYLAWSSSSSSSLHVCPAGSLRMNATSLPRCLWHHQA